MSCVIPHDLNHTAETPVVQGGAEQLSASASELFLGGPALAAPRPRAGCPPSRSLPRLSFESTGCSQGDSHELQTVFSQAYCLGKIYEQWPDLCGPRLHPLRPFHSEPDRGEAQKVAESEYGPRVGVGSCKARGVCVASANLQDSEKIVGVMK